MKLLVVAGIMLLSGSCNSAGDEPTATDPGISATYDLQSIGGMAPPVWLGRRVINPPTPGGASVSCDDSLVTSSLSLKVTGTFDETDGIRTTCNDGRASSDDVRTYHGTYESVAPLIQLFFSAGNAFALTSASGHTFGTELILDHREMAGGLVHSDSMPMRYSQRTGRPGH